MQVGQGCHNFASRIHKGFLPVLIEDILFIWGGIRNWKELPCVLFKKGGQYWYCIWWSMVSKIKSHIVYWIHFIWKDMLVFVSWSQRGSNKKAHPNDFISSKAQSMITRSGKHPRCQGGWLRYNFDRKG